jgi:tetratricopeptide (TPR) repeat protein
MTSTLTDWLNAGRYLDVLLSDAAGHLIDGFVTSLPLSTREEGDDTGNNTNTSTNTNTNSSTNSTKVSAQDRLAIGLAALNAFLQGNVTGPVLDEKALRRVEGRLCSSEEVGVEPSAQQQRQRELRKACLRSLDVDGVSVYEHVPMIEVFCLARHVLVTLGTPAGRGAGGDGVVGITEAAARSPEWLALRVRVWHYKLLTQPSLGPGSVFNKASQWCDVPSLQGAIEKGLQELEEEIVGSGKAWSNLEKVQFLVEKANVCISLGLDRMAKEALQKATELSGFVYALSGALGKRTKFQQKSTSQLVVLAKSGEGVSTDDEQAKPQALALNDDTLLEGVEFSKEKPEGDPKSELPVPLKNLSPDEQPQLSPMDQIILLAEATVKDAFSPADTLTSEEVLPFAVRVISDKSTNWQIYTHALLVRSRIEMHRSRTIERGVLQMQAVVDQVIVDTTQPTTEDTPETVQEFDAAVPEIKITGDREEAQKPDNKPTSFFPAAKPTESAPAQVRLEHLHALSSPPRWHLESELAYSWAGVGSLVSALEIFKRLRLWAEVALCYASSAAKEDEDGRGSSGEAKAKAILRWRLYHKTGTSPEQQDKSGEIEEVDVDVLKESDYHGPERQPAPSNAPRLWCILGDIENDPAHYERAWELSKHRFARAQKSLGEYYLQNKDIDRARDAYRKAVTANRLSSELWNRMGDISLRLGDFSGAAEAFSRAIASSDNITGGEDARTWSNLGSAFYSLYVERVKELKEQKETGTTDDQLTTAPATAATGIYDDEEEDLTPSSNKPTQADPSTLLSQALAAYKRGAGLAHDNWRIWDNVVTLAARLRPLPVSDLLLALRSVARIRASEDALDVDVLRLLLNEAVLAPERPAASNNAGAGAGADANGEGKKTGVYEPPRGSPQRAVCDFLEGTVVPLVTARSELWELVARERVWRADYAGAVDASEKAWRAAVGSVAAAGGGGLLPSSGGKGDSGRNWLEDREGWKDVVERTDDLVSILENYGEEVPEIGARWKGKARSAVRSVMGKAKENWEGSEEWERLVALLEGLR